MTSSTEVIDEAEVVIIGAGPAGAAAAATLISLGHEVILIDQNEFPRDKPCGDALWSSAVRELLDLGLDGLVYDAQPIVGTRAIRINSGSTVERIARDSKGRPFARCIPRLKTDAALLHVSLAQGARFVLGRVHELIEGDGRVAGVVIRRKDGSRFAVHAHWVIAADGATSRVRRLVDISSRGDGPKAYAVRQYFRTEKVADPMFEIQLPLRIRHKFVPGYSWVFPLSNDVVNVGVGLFAPPRSQRSAASSPRELLNDFVMSLKTSAATRFGDLESLSEPSGAPVAIGYSARSAKKGNVFFVGDAARMTDPYTGDGMAAALISGREAARQIDNSLKRGTRPNFGNRLLQGFPRLAQDNRFVVRAYDHIITDAWPREVDAASGYRDHPLLDSVLRGLMLDSGDIPTIESAPVMQLATVKNDRAHSALIELNALALRTFSTEFPFAFELLQRRIRAGAGPTAGAALLLVDSTCDGKQSERSLAGAFACQLLILTTHFMNQIDDVTDQCRINLGNGFATLIADYALSRGLQLAASLGSKESIYLACASRTIYEGAAADADDAWDLARTPERYLFAAADHDGTLHAHAAALGARLAGADGVADNLAEYGQNLGIALRISNDVVELLDGDYPTASEPGDDLRHGNFTLAVIYALEEDPDLAQLLTQETIEDSVGEALATIRRTHAVERCVAECKRYTGAALAALEGLNLQDDSLRDLANMAVDRCSAFLPESADRPPH